MMPKTRSKAQIVKNRREVAELHFEGWFQEDIATKLGLSQATVSRDLRHVVDQWQAEAAEEIEKKKAIIEQRYLLIWREAIAAWRVKSNSRYLAQAMAALKGMRELLGTDAVVRHEIKQVEEIVITADEMAAAVKRNREWETEQDADNGTE